MPPSSESSQDRGRLFRRLVLAGFGLRIALMLVSRGTNDIATWLSFAESVRDLGLEQTYLELDRFNHPPLMGLMAMLVLRISEATQLPFPMLFKVPPLIAEAVTAWLLYRIWAERVGSEAGWRAAAAYALALGPIVISGYHGNTDAIYFCLAVAAAYLMESMRAPFWAGLAMAAALDVKLIPLVAVLPLWSRCIRPRDAGRYALGGLVGALPFFWALATFAPGSRRVFLERLLLYRSNLEYWGIELFVRGGEALLDPVVPALGHVVRSAGDLYIGFGGELVMIASAALAVAHVAATRSKGRVMLDSYELMFLGFVVFLLFGPGFGVQYVGCVVAPLMAMDVKRGWVVATVTGVYITSVYVYFVVDWSPIYSVHIPTPAGFMPLALVAWGVVLWAGWGLFRPLRAPDPVTQNERRTLSV